MHPTVGNKFLFSIAEEDRRYSLSKEYCEILERKTKFHQKWMMVKKVDLGKSES
jgi:hypothetical protein